MRAKSLKAVAVAVAGTVFAASTFAQATNCPGGDGTNCGTADVADTAYVPFVIDANSTIIASFDDDSPPVTRYVLADTENTLAIPLRGTNAARFTGRAQGRQNAPIVSGSRGNITLRLPAQSYQNAEISLHSVNGKRILRANAAASETAAAISRQHVAAGAYLLSVKGINGSAFTTRLTHKGGDMNISVAFGAGNVTPGRKLAKSATATEEWTVRIIPSSPDIASDYCDSTYTLGLAAGTNPLQEINLKTGCGGQQNLTFTDSRDGQIYRAVVIGNQIWMAENLKYSGDPSTPSVVPIGVCYENSLDSCDKYGRLYSWAEANTLCPAEFHLPSDDEWAELADFAGDILTAGGKLKSTSGWNNNGTINGNGTDEYGFKALPGGRGYSSGVFGAAGNSGAWWTATGSGAAGAYARGMGNGHAELTRAGQSKENMLFSVRCVAHGLGWMGVSH